MAPMEVFVDDKSVNPRFSCAAAKKNGVNTTVDLPNKPRRIPFANRMNMIDKSGRNDPITKKVGSSSTDVRESPYEVKANSSASRHTPGILKNSQIKTIGYTEHKFTSNLNKKTHLNKTNDVTTDREAKRVVASRPTGTRVADPSSFRRSLRATIQSPSERKTKIGCSHKYTVQTQETGKQMSTSFRRSLRDTIKPPNNHEAIIKSGTLETPATQLNCSIENPRNLVVESNHASRNRASGPKTPISLLNEEMENGADISLLCSPNAVLATSVTNACSEIISICDTGKTVQANKATGTKNSLKSKVFAKPRSRLELIAANARERNLNIDNVRKSNGAVLKTPSVSHERKARIDEKYVSEFSTETDNTHCVLSDVAICTKKSPLTTTDKITKEENNVKNVSKIVSRKQQIIKPVVKENCDRGVIVETGETLNADKLIIDDIESHKQPLIQENISKSHAHSNLDDCHTKAVESVTRGTSHWYSAMPASIIQPNKTVSIQPFTPRNNGVCMDLTDIFIDAATARSSESSVSNLKAMQTARKYAKRSPISNSEDRARAQGNEDSGDWALKQCQAFTQWLNYTFAPTEDTEMDAIDSTVDRIALRSLEVHRRMARARFEAIAVYRGAEMAKVRSIISSEVQKGRISIRKDRNLHADLAMRNQLMSLLFSYSTPWLRLGLETLFGVPILPVERPTANSTAVKIKKSTFSRMKMALKNFIVERVLSDEKILVKYTKGRCLVPSGPFEKKYNTELNAVILQRLLILVMFLDAGKRSNILDKVPNLFMKDSEVKSTREVLLHLCKDFLQAEGDFVKHLSRLGLKVFYKQEPIDELDFVVNNLAVDLRDGTRLVKLVEILTGVAPKSLLLQLRLPVVSRLQKLHNVGVALKEFCRYGVPLTSDIAAHHIVDGHRQMVLKLLWIVVAHCCIRTLVDIDKVEAEIARISHSQRPKENTVSPVDGTGLENLKDVLLRWCHAICSHVGVKVNNLTKDFANGKVVCHLIHFYHPTLLRIDEINPTTDDILLSQQPSQEQLEELYSNERSNANLANKRLSELGGIPEMIPICDSRNVPEEKSMLFCLTFLCSRLIESSHEIKACVVIQNWFRPYYNKITQARKSAAALIILKAWQSNMNNFYRAQEAKYKASVLKIERFLSANRSGLIFLKENRRLKEDLRRASVVIQASFRGVIARRQRSIVSHRSKIVTKLQTFWRAFSARRAYERLKVREESAVTIQCFWKRAQSQIQRRHHAATQIQRLWRGFWSQLRFQIDVFDIITVQSCVRRKLAWMIHGEKIKSVIVIQNSAKQFLSRSMLMRSSAAQRIQCFVRQRQSYTNLRKKRMRFAAALSVQCCWRQFSAMSTVRRLIQERERSNAATLIQSFWRGCHSRIILRSLKLVKWRVVASIVIQSSWRTSIAKNAMEALRREKKSDLAILTVQNFVRTLRAKRMYFNLQKGNARFKASIFIQNVWRLHQARVHIRNLRTARKIVSFSRILSRMHTMAGIIIQKSWRRKKAWIALRTRYFVASKIQSFVRMFFQRTIIFRARFNAIKIQSKWRSVSAQTIFKSTITKIISGQAFCRSWHASRVFNRRKESVLLLQCFARQRHAMRCLDRLRDINETCTQASIILQKYWRKFVTLKRFQSTREKIILLQSIFRGMVATKVSATRKAAIITLQNALRCFLACRCFARVLAENQKKERKEKNASVLIQAYYRGHVERNERRRLHRASISIQSAFRCFLCKTDYQILILDVMITQIVARQWFARRVANRRLHAKLQLQSAARGFLVRILTHRILSARIIQRVFRGYVGRSIASEHFAARLIQKTWRCYDVHCDFMLVCIKTIRMQAYARRCASLRLFARKIKAITQIQSFSRLALYKISAKKRDAAVTVIQAFARMIPYRNDYLDERNQHRMAMILQSYFRMANARSQYILVKIAADFIQKAARGFLVRSKLEDKRYAAIQIQRIWKGYFVYSEFALKVLSVVRLQSYVRMIQSKGRRLALLNEQLASQFLQKRRVSIIQRLYRQKRELREMNEASSQIQSAFKAHRSRMAFKNLRRGFTRFQSAIRGKNVRSKRSMKIAALVARIAHANLNAKVDPKMQLGHRTRAALDLLMKSRSLSEIMNAICLLELATRYSENCCIAFANAGAPDILFPLIRSCNRSLPHIEILRCVLLTLTNVARYDYLLPSMASAEAAEIFLDLVQMFRDKESIFPLAASLLERIVTNDDEVKIHCASRENQKRLRGIVQLVIRKLSISSTDCFIDSYENSGVAGRTRSAQKRKPRSNYSSILKHQESKENHSGLHSLQRVLGVLS